MNGWISISRGIQNHWLWKEKRKLSKFEAWIDILLKVNYKDVEIVVGKQKVLLSKGSLLTSELKLCDEWKWSRDTVRKFLKQLETDKMIFMKHTTKYTIVTVVNWELYQNTQQQTVQQNNSETYNKLYNNYPKKGTIQSAMEWTKRHFRYTTRFVNFIQQTIHRIIIYIFIYINNK